MKTTEQQMLVAVRRLQSNKALKGYLVGSNTYIGSVYGITFVQLKNCNTIFELHPDGIVKITLAGWNTVTTRSRINSLLKHFVSCEYQVVLENGKPYLVSSEGKRYMELTEKVTFKNGQLV